MSSFLCCICPPSHAPSQKTADQKKIGKRDQNLKQLATISSNSEATEGKTSFIAKETPISISLTENVFHKSKDTVSPVNKAHFRHLISRLNTVLFQQKEIITLLVDRSFFIMATTQSAKWLTGLSEKQIVGKHITSFLSKIDNCEQDEYLVITNVTERILKYQASLRMVEEIGRTPFPTTVQMELIALNPATAVYFAAIIRKMNTLSESVLSPYVPESSSKDEVVKPLGQSGVDYLRALMKKTNLESIETNESSHLFFTTKELNADNKLFETLLTDLAKQSNRQQALFSLICDRALTIQAASTSLSIKTKYRPNEIIGQSLSDFVFDAKIGKIQELTNNSNRMRVVFNGLESTIDCILTVSHATASPHYYHLMTFYEIRASLHTSPFPLPSSLNFNHTSSTKSTSPTGSLVPTTTPKTISIPSSHSPEEGLLEQKIFLQPSTPYQLN